MSDKTCGECKWFALVPGCASRGACLRFDDYGTFVLRGANYDACDGGYEERGDSVERVALNMLDILLCLGDTTAYRVYGDRLRALGVVE